MGRRGHSGYNRSPMTASDNRPAGPRLQIDQLTKRYGARAALDGLSFSLQPGCFAALLGHIHGAAAQRVEPLAQLLHPRAGGEDRGRERRRISGKVAPGERHSDCHAHATALALPPSPACEP